MREAILDIIELFSLLGFLAMMATWAALISGLLNV
jgi:hypothetical protein